MVRDANPIEEEVCHLLTESFLEAIIKHRAQPKHYSAVCLTLIVHCSKFLYNLTTEETRELQDRYANSLTEITKQFLEEIK